VGKDTGQEAKNLVHEPFEHLGWLHSLAQMTYAILAVAEECNNGCH
jgi:predicted transcriptional regulator